MSSALEEAAADVVAKIKEILDRQARERDAALRRAVIEECQAKLRTDANAYRDVGALGIAIHFQSAADHLESLKEPTP